MSSVGLLTGTLYRSSHSIGLNYGKFCIGTGEAYLSLSPKKVGLYVTTSVPSKTENNIYGLSQNGRTLISQAVFFPVKWRRHTKGTSPWRRFFYLVLWIPKSSTSDYSVNATDRYSQSPLGPWTWSLKTTSLELESILNLEKTASNSNTDRTIYKHRLEINDKTELF